MFIRKLIALLIETTSVLFCKLDIHSMTNILFRTIKKIV